MTENKKELLNWTKHNFATLYYRKYTKIREFIEKLPEDIRIPEGKTEIQKYLISLGF